MDDKREYAQAWHSGKENLRVVLEIAGPLLPEVQSLARDSGGNRAGLF
jgi:hypothetical protein